MQQDTPSTTQVGLKYGFYTAGGSLIVGLVFALLFRTNGDNFLTVFIFAAGISFGMLEFRRGNGDLMAYLQALNVGMVVTAISGLCLGTLGSISAAMLSAKDLEKVRALYMEQFEMQGLTDAQIEAAKPMLDFTLSPAGIFIMTFLGWLMMGAVITLLMGAFMYRKPNK